MKNILSSAIAALFVVGLTFSGLAQSGEKGHEGEKGAAGMEMKHEAKKGKHKMSGTVTQIDKEKGTLTLDTEPTDLELHFPAESIKDLQEGDKITVYLGYEKADGAEGQTK